MGSQPDEIQSSHTYRVERLYDILEQLSEDEINRQPFSTKKSIGEIAAHVLMIDTTPFFLVRRFYRTMNLLNGTVKRSNKKDLLAEDYEWDTSTGTGWSSKQVSKDKLVAKAQKVREKSINIKDGHLDIWHIVERHANKHLKQIELLFNNL